MYKSALSVNGSNYLTSSPFLSWLIALNPRLNTKLESNGYPPMSSLVKDLSDGVRLIQLMVRELPIWKYSSCWKA